MDDFAVSVEKARNIADQFIGDQALTPNREGMYLAHSRTRDHGDDWCFDYVMKNAHGYELSVYFVVVNKRTGKPRGIDFFGAR